MKWPVLKLPNKPTMPTAIAIHWNDTELQFAVAEDGTIEAVSHITLDTGLDPTAIGHSLAESLAPQFQGHFQGRTKVVVALPRSALEWQHLSLPPCPDDELPDVVRLQSDRDLGDSDEDVGFDYLPLEGDEQTPYQVLTVSLPATEMAKIREVCRAANLTIERIVPLAAGWPAITQQASPSVKLGTQIFVAPQDSEATLWATRAGRVVLFRQFQLANADEPAAQTNVVSNELRRTLLALSQHAENGKPAVSLVGCQNDRIADLANSLNDQLDVPVQLLNATSNHPNLTNNDTPSATLPLAGLAIAETQGEQPLVDLLHPRRRAKTHINIRTYALAATAGSLLLAMLGWSSYAKLQAPLNQAAEDQAELTLLEESLDDLQKSEQRAAAIRDWKAEAPNLLLHLQQLSQSIRPEALDAENFPADQDIVLEKMDLNKRELLLDAFARNSRAVQPLESRLRESNYRPQRGKSDPSQTVKEYPWHFKSTIEITSASDTTSQPANPSASEPAKEPTAEEPQT